MTNPTTAKPASFKFGFISGVLAELKKVVWLSRREVSYLTLLVLIVSAAASLVLGLFDYGFSALVQLLVGS